MSSFSTNPAARTLSTGVGGYLLDVKKKKLRDPHTVRNWYVLWRDQSEAFALRGPFCFCADIAAALKDVENHRDVRGKKIVSVDCVELVPHANDAPQRIWDLAKSTRFKLKNNDFHRRVQHLLDESDVILPDFIQMLEICK